MIYGIYRLLTRLGILVRFSSLPPILWLPEDTGKALCIGWGFITNHWQLGELSQIYSAADYVFCGCSLVDRDRHNILEAASWEAPVFYGPNMKDFQDTQKILEENGGGIMVRSGADITSRIKELAEDKDLYRRVAEGTGISALIQHGASEKQLSPILKVLREVVC